MNENPQALSSAHSLIAAYTRVPNSEYSAFMSQSVHFAVRKGSSGVFQPLYLGKGKLYAACEFNEENGIVSMGLHDIVMYRLGDEYLITARETRRTRLDDNNYAEKDTGRFVRWSTEDFVTFTSLGVNASRLTAEEQSMCSDISAVILPDGLEYSESAAVIAIEDGIADRLLQNNITVEFASVEVPQTVIAGSKSELENIKATVRYTDGSIHQKHVFWDADSIDFAKAGRYTVEGQIAVRRFGFPVEDHPWADPVVTYYNGRYYFIATNDADGQTSFEIRKAETPEALFEAGARRATILDAQSCVYKNTFWAPEFHMVGGKLRIFCALTINKGFDPQCYIMTLNDDSDLLDRNNWSAPARVLMPDGRTLGTNPLVDGKNGITLDMTCFEAGGKTYAVWSYRTWMGTDSGSMLMIARMNPDAPEKLLSCPVLLTRPYFGWEHNTGTDNNEGPYAIVADDKVYLTYSAGDARGQMYVIGMMTANVGDDLCDVSSWTTSSAPVLATHYVPGEYGPGHNAFFTDEYGDLYITYHAGCTSKRSNIRPAIRRVHFRNDGTPMLSMTHTQDLPPEYENVQMTVVIEPKE